MICFILISANKTKTKIHESDENQYTKYMSRDMKRIDY